jgi:hypothetical protein
MTDVCNTQIAAGILCFGPGKKNRTRDGDASGYSYRKKIVQPLKSEPAAEEGGDFISASRVFFENEILPISDAHIGPGGRYFIPPRLIEDHRRMFAIMAARERGFVRLINVLQRHCDKTKRFEGLKGAT